MDKPEQYKVEIELTADQWTRMSIFMTRMENTIMDSPDGAEKEMYYYPFSKIAMQIDVGIHKVLPDICKPGDFGCYVEENVARFKKIFADEIAEDEGMVNVNND